MGLLERAVKLTLGGTGVFDQGVGFLGRHDIFDLVAASNVAVTHSRALQVPSYSASVRVISEDLASVPLVSYRRTAAGKVRADDHPTYRVLHDAPNPYMTSMVFRETLQGHVLGWGNCYANMVTDGQQVVTAMWPLRPDRTQPRIDESSGRLFYRVTLPSGETRDLRREEVFHLPGLGFDGITGYPVLTAMMRESLGSAIAQQEYVGRLYANDARPGITLVHPKTLSDTAKKNILASWDENHSGLSNAHRTSILEEGMDIKTFGINPVEQQLLESRKWSAVEIGAAFRLAPWKIGVYDRATWGNVEDGNIDHWQSALRAWFVRWEQQLNLQVYGVGSEVFAEHLIDGILRGNAESRARFYFLMRQASGITANEIRNRENLPTDPSPQADELFAPLNMGPLDATDALPPPTPPGPGGTVPTP